LKREALVTKVDNNVETQQRLLDAAGEVFAEHGFRAATIRDICQHADANVAAVHYHFGDKKELYLAVLKSFAGEALKKYPPTWGLTESATAEEKLHAFIHSFLLRITDKGRPAWHGKLMGREIAEPTSALDALIDDVYRPLVERLEDIIRELIGRPTGDEVVLACARSVLGQCLYYYHARPVIERMTPRQQFESADVERLAEHITKFTRAALKEYRP
jgi:TetR/AcrR family transcriptional regulator, regulator of cefoperazone and chloramphenicol sensitivity